jgi:hypothetical protein
MKLRAEKVHSGMPFAQERAVSLIASLSPNQQDCFASLNTKSTITAYHKQGN